MGERGERRRGRVGERGERKRGREEEREETTLENAHDSLCPMNSVLNPVY